MNMPLRKQGRGEIQFGLPGLRDDLNRLYDMVSRGEFGLEQLREWGKFFPALDVAEDDEAVVIKADVPGLEPKDIDVSISGQNLTIKGEKSEETQDTARNYHRTERRYGSFSRTVTLPSGVEADKIKAECAKGVLTITLPKAASEKARRIPVKSED
jgi:HSP20 family protein